jgi:membrane-associated phospholipid phosphatase
MGDKSTIYYSNESSFIAWPRWDIIKVTLKLSLVFLVVFYALFGLTDYITHLHSYRIRAHLSWELETPFIPSMSVIYMSISPMLCLAPFIIRTIKVFKLFFKIMIVETIIAAIFFMILPVENAYPDKQITGLFSSVFHLADLVNLTYNELPSLHVAFAFTTAYFFSRKIAIVGKYFLFLWASLVALSTLLTHQHHLISVLSGITLSWVVVKIVR